MQRSNPDRQFGAKLLPPMISAIVKSIIATKTGLASHEHLVRTRASQEIIDRMGHEAADHFAGLMSLVLSQDELHPELRSFFEKAASGNDQWQAAGQFLFQSSGIAGALGQAIGNAVAPVVYELNSLGPNLLLDPPTAAAASVRGLVTPGFGAQMARKQGTQQVLFEVMEFLAQTIPDATTLFQLWNRRVIGEQQVRTYLHRNGFTESAASEMMQLAAAILSPSDAALAVLRGNITEHEGLSIARQSGLDQSQFNLLVDNTGEPPGAEELMAALRRGFIDQDRFTRGIRESRVRNEWVPTLLKLRYTPMSTADAVQARVQNYIDTPELHAIAQQNGLEPGHVDTLLQAAGEPLSRTEMTDAVRRGLATKGEYAEALRQSRLKNSYIGLSEKMIFNPPTTADAIESSIQGYMPKAEARKIASENGLAGQYFDALWNTAGAPLSKTEMLTLLKRGHVTKQDVRDALKQSRLKNAYIEDALKLAETLPPLFEVRSLLSAGALSTKEATHILLQEGYQDNIVKAIIKASTASTTASSKDLTEAMYAELYQEHAITAEEFRRELVALGYSPAQSELIETIYDQKIAITNRNAVISKVRALYTSNKIDETQTQHDLNALGLPSDMVDKLMEDWKLIVASNVKLLTPAQVVDAWFMDLFAPGDTAGNLGIALDYLNRLGYSGNDATVLLEIKNKGPLTNAST